MDVKGQVAIVTGSGTGLGAAVARKLAARGMHVVVNYSRKAKEAEEVAAECRAAGAEAIAVQADVGADADCRRLAQAALDRFGRIDALVNNAGTTKFAAHGDLDALAAQDFLDIYRVNVAGAFQMVRACAPAMKKQGAGAVVNVSSVAGLTGIGSSIAYAASKGAMNTMTLSLARALAPEIRVNAVCPGFIQTRWFSDRFGAEMTERIAESQRQTTPLKRAGTPEDVADSVVFLCTEGARHITGIFLSTDAGLHLNPQV